MRAVFCASSPFQPITRRANVTAGSPRESRTYIIDQISFHGALLGSFYYIGSEAKETPSPAADVQCCRFPSTARRTWPKTSMALCYPASPATFYTTKIGLSFLHQAEPVPQQSLAKSGRFSSPDDTSIVHPCRGTNENYKQPRQTSFPATSFLCCVFFSPQLVDKSVVY